jgi:hypothetical protein
MGNKWLNFIFLLCGYDTVESIIGIGIFLYLKIIGTASAKPTVMSESRNKLKQD